MIYESILDLIGNTPIVQHDNIFVKLEAYNPSGSIKDRISLSMISGMLKDKKITKDSIICEPTSGNTGIGIAMVCAYLKMRCVLVMPSNMSEERILAIKAYGAEIILTNASLGMSGAIAKAHELANKKGYIILDQFSNQYNPLGHIKTAQEIIKDFNHLDYFVCGIGTGGTITGVSKELKKHYQNIKIIGIEPLESPIITKNMKGTHSIQGIGAGLIPNNLDLTYIDEIITISSLDALNEFKSLAKSGLFVGISSAANIFVSKEIYKKNNSKIILTISSDSGLKYLSVIK